MKNSKKSGFSVVELAFVAGIIGLLALLAIPELSYTRNRTAAIATANDIRLFAEAIEFYSTERGSYPESMTYETITEEAASYIPSAWVGGEKYFWNYQNIDAWTRLHVYDLRYTPEQIQLIDSIIDDGKPVEGKIRIGGTNVFFIFRSSL